MKKQFTLGGIFLIAYVGFLIATLPATVLINKLPLPKAIQLSGVTGSIWHTKVQQIELGTVTIQKVHTQLSFWSLFTLTPKLAITFGDSFSAGPEGEFELAISQKKVQISDLKLLVKANEIAQQLTLPLPISAQGDVELTMLNAEVALQKDNQCIAAKGTVIWSKSAVLALDQNIKLGNITADIDCENGALALIISPKNDLGLTFNAYMRKGGRLSGNGFLKPGANFPQALSSALPFLGRKDSQGRYRLSF